MKIKKLDIQGFGRLENRGYTFQPGLNIVYGANESGKSTMQAFIKGMFFGLKGGRRTKDGFLPPARQFKPWFARVYGGSMEYELDNGQWYVIGRNFEKNTFHIHDQYANNITGEFPAGKDEGSKFAEQHLGLSESCFERTVFIGQLQSAIDSEGKKILAERFMNIRQSADEEVSYRKAVKALKDAQLSFVGSERSTIRPLNRIQSRLDEALEQEQEGRKLHESSMDTFLELDKAKEEEKRLKTELQRLLSVKEKLENNAQMDELRKMLQKLKEFRDTMTQVEAEQKNIIVQLRSMEEKTADLIGYQDFSRNDADAMVSENTRFHFIAEEYRQVVQVREEVEENRVKAEKALSQYDFFEQSGSKVETVLSGVLHQDEGEIQKEKEQTDQRIQTLHRLQSRRKFSMAGVVAAFLLLIGTVVLQKGLSDLLSRILMISSGFIFFFMAGLWFHSWKKQRYWIKKQKPNDEEYQRKQAQHEENWALLHQWMKEVNVEHLQDFIRLKGLYEDKKQQHEALEKEKNTLDEKERNLRAQKDALAASITDRLNRAGFQTGPEGFDEEQIQSWKEGLEAYLSLMPSKKTWEKEQAAVTEKRDSLYREISLTCGEDIKTQNQLTLAIEIREEQLSKREIIQVAEEENLTRIRSQIDEVNDKIQQNQLRINTLKTRLESIPDGEFLQQIHEKIQQLTDEKEFRLHTGKAIDIALQVLSDASLAIQRDYVPALNQEMGGILSRITDNRYHDIKADDRLHLHILSPGSSDWILPEQLSSGTTDQVYLALRLSAVRLVEKEGESMPLFLDEPFVQYDEQRTKNALLLLSEESVRRQIVLFTCKEREVEMAEALFDNRTMHRVIL